MVAARSRCRLAGTVGAVALDSGGRIVAGTSTGGMANKKWGRIGDSPLIGAGTWASSRCGVSCTGWGEYFIRNGVAHDIDARIDFDTRELRLSLTAVDTSTGWFPLDPLVPEERYMAIYEDLNDIQAPGTYYIHVLTIYPEFHRKGIASTLLSLALKQTAEKGFAECSLFVFAENVGAIALYEKHGFKEAARTPVTEHPLLYYTGDMLLMTCVV